MAKIIHTMIRVLDEKRSVDFYHAAFGFVVVARFDFEDFVLVYLRNEENDVEIELTINRSRVDSYSHGDGYGHVAVCVEDLDSEHRRLKKMGFAPNDIKEFSPNGELMARFFFVQDPDDYKVEVLQRHGRYQ